MNFEFPEDQLFFEQLLCSSKQSLDHFTQLFNFSPPNTKRVNFNSIREARLRELILKHGNICMLNLGVCDLKSGLTVDHLIPLSSNILNKTLRKIKAEKRKKVPSQSLGSNNMENLVLACSKCNGHKKHRFLEREKLREILIWKGLIVE